MLAAVLGALALTGATSPLWSSDAPPRAGQLYVAVSYTGAGGFYCGAFVGPRAVAATIYNVEGVAVCVVRVPAGTVGRKLAIGYEVTEREGQRTTIATGAVKPKLIRR